MGTHHQSARRRARFVGSFAARKGSALLLVALVVSVSLAITTNTAYADHGNGFHWAGNAQRVVNVIDRTGDLTWNKAVQTAIDNWNAGLVGVVRLDHIVAPVGSCTPTAPDISTCLWGNQYDQTDPHSAPYPHFNGVEINFYRNSAKQQTAACHELGHALGLNHRPD